MVKISWETNKWINSENSWSVALLGRRMHLHVFHLYLGTNIGREPYGCCTIDIIGVDIVRLVVITSSVHRG